MLSASSVGDPDWPCTPIQLWRMALDSSFSLTHPMCHFEANVYSRWTQGSSLKQQFMGCVWQRPLQCWLIQSAEPVPGAIHVTNCCVPPRYLELRIQEGCFYFSPDCKENAQSRNLGVEKRWRQVGCDRLFTGPAHRENKEILCLFPSL